MNDMNIFSSKDNIEKNNKALTTMAKNPAFRKEMMESNI